MSDETFYQQLARFILNHRKISGLSQLQLAELAGVGKTVIYDLEHAKPSVQLDTVVKVLHALNIKIQLHSPIEGFDDV